MLDHFVDQANLPPEREAQLSEYKEESLMIDPSLFLSHSKYIQIREIIISKEGGTFYLPSSFVSGLKTRDSQMLSFYRGRSKSLPLASLYHDIIKFKQIKYFSVNTKENQYSKMYSLFQDHFGKGKLADSLLEEWVFLQTQSWIVSRSDKAMRAFINQGAAALETSKELFDRLVDLTLKISPKRVPTNKERLRAVAKWIAVGCPSFLSIYASELKSVVDFASGFFLLVDP